MFCRFCGAANPDDARVCGSCHQELLAPAQADPPGAQTPDAAASPETADRIARMGDRFLAVVLDTIVIAAVFALSGMVLARELGGLTASGFSLEGTAALLAVSATALIAFAYYWLSEAYFGATLGKGIIGIRVRRKDGGPCDLRASLFRNLLRLFDGIAVYLVGFFVAILTGSRQRIGDHLAGTVVVESKGGGALRAGLVFLWLLAAGAGLTGAYLLHQSPAETSVAAAGAPPAVPAAIPPASIQEEATPAATVNLAAAGNLKAVNFEFLESRDGPPRPPSPYRPGDTVHAKYDVVDYSTDSSGRPNLDYHLSALDPNGVLLIQPWEHSFNQRMDSGAPVHGSYNLTLPTAVPAGTCNLVLRVRDEHSGDELELTAPFRIDAPALAPASDLEVRDFELALSREGPAVDVPKLQGSGTLYMRCSISGLRFRGDETDVQMGLKVLAPSGKVLFDKPDYEQISGPWFYHPPTFHVPITGHLSVPSGLEHGGYKAVYTFSDKIAGRTVVVEGRFTVE